MEAIDAKWFSRAALIVLVVTSLRLLVLGLSKADVFVDEAQYWLWGQSLDFGYYSKPPLIAWVIRAVTDLAGSDSALWIRFPAPIFHGATALILGALAARVFNGRAAIWTTVSYVTLPIVALGSLVISTDTIMAPFLAAGLLFYWKMLGSRRTVHAILTGTMIGAAFMSKYAGVYFFFGAILSALLMPSHRPTLKNLIALLASFAAVISPNVIWNLSNSLTTVEHTIDNVGWVREDAPGASLNLGAFLEFASTQFAVMGPVLLVALVLATPRADRKLLPLLLFSLPIILLVCFQALMSYAYGNWAFAAYIAGTVAAVGWLAQKSTRWLWVSLAINSIFTVAVPAIAISGDQINVDGKPILLRNMGREEFSRQVLLLSEQVGPSAIVASNRDILADLFLTGRDQDIPIKSIPPKGRPRNYYEQNFALEEDTSGLVLLISSDKVIECNGETYLPTQVLDTVGTAYEGAEFAAFTLDPVCVK